MLKEMASLKRALKELMLTDTEKSCPFVWKCCSSG